MKTNVYKKVMSGLLVFTLVGLHAAEGGKGKKLLAMLRAAEDKKKSDALASAAVTPPPGFERPVDLRINPTGMLPNHPLAPRFVDAVQRATHGQPYLGIHDAPIFSQNDEIYYTFQTNIPCPAFNGKTLEEVYKEKQAQGQPLLMVVGERLAQWNKERFPLPCSPVYSLLEKFNFERAEHLQPYHFYVVEYSPKHEECVMSPYHFRKITTHLHDAAQSHGTPIVNEFAKAAAQKGTPEANTLIKRLYPEHCVNQAERLLQQQTQQAQRVQSEQQALIKKLQAELAQSRAQLVHMTSQATQFQTRATTFEGIITRGKAENTELRDMVTRGTTINQRLLQMNKELQQSRKDLEESRKIAEARFMSVTTQEEREKLLERAYKKHTEAEQAQAAAAGDLPQIEEIVEEKTAKTPAVRILKPGEPIPAGMLRPVPDLIPDSDSEEEDTERKLSFKENPNQPAHRETPGRTRARRRSKKKEEGVDTSLITITEVNETAKKKDKGKSKRVPTPEEIARHKAAEAQDAARARCISDAEKASEALAQQLAGGTDQAALLQEAKTTIPRTHQVNADGAGPALILTDAQLARQQQERQEEEDAKLAVQLQQQEVEAAQAAQPTAAQVVAKTPPKMSKSARRRARKATREAEAAKALAERKAKEAATEKARREKEKAEREARDAARRAKLKAAQEAKELEAKRKEEAAEEARRVKKAAAITDKVLSKEPTKEDYAKKADQHTRAQRLTAEQRRAQKAEEKAAREREQELERRKAAEKKEKAKAEKKKAAEAKKRADEALLNAQLREKEQQERKLLEQIANQTITNKELMQCVESEFFFKRKFTPEEQANIIECFNKYFATTTDKKKKSLIPSLMEKLSEQTDLDRCYLFSFLEGIDGDLLKEKYLPSDKTQIELIKQMISNITTLLDSKTYTPSIDRVAPFITGLIVYVNKYHNSVNKEHQETAEEFYHLLGRIIDEYTTSLEDTTLEFLDEMFDGPLSKEFNYPYYCSVSSNWYALLTDNSLSYLSIRTHVNNCTDLTRKEKKEELKKLEKTVLLLQGKKSLDTAKIRKYIANPRHHPSFEEQKENRIKHAFLYDEALTNDPTETTIQKAIITLSEISTMSADIPLSESIIKEEFTKYCASLTKCNDTQAPFFKEILKEIIKALPKTHTALKGACLSSLQTAIKEQKETTSGAAAAATAEPTDAERAETIFNLLSKESLEVPEVTLILELIEQLSGKEELVSIYEALLQNIEKIYNHESTKQQCKVVLSYHCPAAVKEDFDQTVLSIYYAPVQAQTEEREVFSQEVAESFPQAEPEEELSRPPLLGEFRFEDPAGATQEEAPADLTKEEWIADTRRRLLEEEARSAAQIAQSQEMFAQIGDISASMQSGEYTPEEQQEQVERAQALLAQAQGAAASGGSAAENHDDGAAYQITLKSALTQKEFTVTMTNQDRANHNFISKTIELRRIVFSDLAELVTAIQKISYLGKDFMDHIAHNIMEANINFEGCSNGQLKLLFNCFTNKKQKKALEKKYKKKK